MTGKNWMEEWFSTFAGVCEWCWFPFWDGQ